MSASKIYPSNVVEVEIKSVYGKELIYPVSPAAEIIAAIAGTKTLSVADLKNANKLGLVVIEVKRNYAPIAKMLGSQDDEYAIYCTNAAALGWNVKSYDQWLNS